MKARVKSRKFFETWLKDASIKFYLRTTFFKKKNTIPLNNKMIALCSKEITVDEHGEVDEDGAKLYITDDGWIWREDWLEFIEEEKQTNGFIKLTFH